MYTFNITQIDAQLSDDREKLAEVVFRWLEQVSSVTWADIASLCKQTGFNKFSAAIVKAYESGKSIHQVLPIHAINFLFKLIYKVTLL